MVYAAYAYRTDRYTGYRNITALALKWGKYRKLSEKSR